MTALSGVGARMAGGATADVMPPFGPTAETGTDPSAPTRLPAAAFSSLAFQAKEDAAIWSRFRVCVGFDAEIPQAGDVLPFTVGHHGIHIERLADGTLVGRFNKAQHGGCRAVPLQCQTGAKTRCSFTACGYSRDRRPIRADDPGRIAALDQYLGLRPERLLPVAIETWGPLLLARLDPRDANSQTWPDAGELFAPGEPRPSPDTEWRELASNWKQVAVALGETGAPDAMILFPNVVLRRDGDLVVAAILQPIALDRTLCRIRTYGCGRRAPDEAEAKAAADALMHDAMGYAGRSDVDALRSSPFEAEVARAVAALELETPEGRLFRTDGKDFP